MTTLLNSSTVIGHNNTLINSKAVFGDNNTLLNSSTVSGNNNKLLNAVFGHYNKILKLYFVIVIH